MSTTADQMDRAAAQRAVSRALLLHSLRAQYADLVRLDAELRTYVTALLAEVAGRSSRPRAGSLESYHELARLRAIEDQVCHPLGDQTLSAIVHLTMLARDLRWLLRMSALSSEEGR